MNCPICNNKMPFGLQIHMTAAHGSESVKKQLRFAQEGNGISPKSRKGGHAKRRQGKPFGKKPPKPPRPNRY